MKTCKEIIVEYCKSIGADGLCDPDNECGCELEDICLASNDFSQCLPAKRTQCKECKLLDECDYRKEYECAECFKLIEEKLIDN